MNHILLDFFYRASFMKNKIDINGSIVIVRKFASDKIAWWTTNLIRICSLVYFHGVRDFVMKVVRQKNLNKWLNVCDFKIPFITMLFMLNTNGIITMIVVITPPDIFFYFNPLRLNLLRIEISQWNNKNNSQ